MTPFFEKLFTDTGMSEGRAEVVGFVLSIVVAVLICVLALVVTRFTVVKVAKKTIQKTRYVWDNILFEKRFFHRVSHIVVPITASFLSESFTEHLNLIQRFITIYTITVLLWLIDSVLNTIDVIYRKKEISKVKPIKGFLQVIKVIVFIFGGIVAIAALIGQSPLVMLGGIGAMTAVTSLVFKDSILGFVAGIQLTTNDMIRIGDWIEMPKYSADGDVIELSLTTVKVQNFDKTITTIPAYALVSDAFINWRGMVFTGGRRIKRAIYIDAGTIKLCDDKLIERFEKIALLKNYMHQKSEELDEYNNTNSVDMSEPVNGRRLTNIGTFRAYITEYLKHHKGIHKDMIMMVRQLAPTDNGVPLEVYAFTNTTVWREYEGIQSDIFDHLLAVAPRFELSVFQHPSSQDIRDSVEKLRNGKR